MSIRALLRTPTLLGRRSLAVARPIRAFASTPLRSAEPPVLTEGEQLLNDKLLSQLAGAKVEVQDVSGGCGSFYAISISHPSFKGLSTIKQHRLVNEVLKDEIKVMHGLQLKTSAE